MKISTRGRYAVRVLIDLAEQGEGAIVPLRDVARRQGISEKYLGQILPLFSKAGLVEAFAGKGGGYRLSRSPKDITVLEILSLTEGELAPVACLAHDAEGCEGKGACRTLPMWREFYRMTVSYFEGITVEDLAEKP